MSSISVALLLSLVVGACAYSSRTLNGMRSLSRRPSMLADNAPTPTISFSKLIVSGFLSKETNFAESFVFTKLHESDSTRWSSICAVTDDVSFAKKRMVSPANVYNGLNDILDFAEVKSETDLDSALVGKDAWVAFNVSSSSLPLYASMAVKHGIKRLVVAVYLNEAERAGGGDEAINKATATMDEHNIAYTVLKFGDVRRMGEAKFPYRIVRGVLPLPEAAEANQMLASDDLMRVIAESVDIPKTFGGVFGIGPGSKLDSEILVYMKSQGWPERVQVGLLMGDMMEKVEAKYAEERLSKKDTPELTKPEAPKKSFAGFFSG